MKEYKVTFQGYSESTYTFYPLSTMVVCAPSKSEAVERAANAYKAGGNSLTNITMYAESVAP